MKIAHLIIAHKNPTQVERMIKALDHPGSDFFLHLDKKTDASLFAFLLDRANVFMITNRASIYWAAFGLAQATINGLREIAPLEGYDYINVISGQDFPIKSPDYIYTYLRKRQGTEFINCDSIEASERGSEARFSKYHLINWRFRFPGIYKLEALINRVLPPRKFPVDHTIVGRSNWFTITVSAARYCINFLDNNPAVYRYYQYCWGADEFIFSTILFNSHFKDQIADSLVYVDWTGQTQGHPRMLGTADLPSLEASDRLFARKFDMDADPQVLERLEGMITLQQ